MKYFIALSLLTIGFVAANPVLIQKEDAFEIFFRMFDPAHLEKNNATCAQAMKDHEFALKEEKKSYWKIVQEIPGQIHGEPYHQFLLHCGRILVPIEIPILSEAAAKEPLPATMMHPICGRMQMFFDFLIKREKESLWKLVPEMPEQSYEEGDIALAFICGRLVLPAKLPRDSTERDLMEKKTMASKTRNQGSQPGTYFPLF